MTTLRIMIPVIMVRNLTTLNITTLTMIVTNQYNDPQNKDSQHFGIKLNSSLHDNPQHDGIQLNNPSA